MSESSLGGDWGLDTKTKILECVIKESKNSSISKISTIGVSKAAGTSESNIYKIFNFLGKSFRFIICVDCIRIGQHICSDFCVSCKNASQRIRSFSGKMGIIIFLLQYNLLIKSLCIYLA